jgi:hypothetical protein
MEGDWVVAAASIIAAIVGAIIGAFGLWFVENRRRNRSLVRFVTSTPEDLGVPLRSLGHFQITFSGITAKELITAGVTVENTGNVVLRDLSFDIRFPQVRSYAFAKTIAEDEKLQKAVVGQFDSDGNKSITISLPFLNPKERFRVITFFDGPPVPCIISCRMEGVTPQTVSTEELFLRSQRRQRITAICGLGLMVVTLTYTIWSGIEGQRHLSSALPDRTTNQSK